MDGALEAVSAYFGFFCGRRYNAIIHVFLFFMGNEGAGAEPILARHT